MAEKSILINNQAGGSAVATRDAKADDTGGNPRVVQLMDKVVRGVGTFDPSSPFRSVTGSDPSQMAGFPWAGTKSSNIELLDAESFAVVVQYQVKSGHAADACVTVLPLVVSDTTNLYEMGFLEPKYFQNYKPVGAMDPLYFSGTPHTNLAQMQTWDICGGSVIVPLIYFDSSEISQVDLWAWPISGNAITSLASDAGTWLSKE